MNNKLKLLFVLLIIGIIIGINKSRQLQVEDLNINLDKKLFINTNIKYKNVFIENIKLKNFYKLKPILSKLNTDDLSFLFDNYTDKYSLIFTFLNYKQVKNLDISIKNLKDDSFLNTLNILKSNIDKNRINELTLDISIQSENNIGNHFYEFGKDELEVLKSLQIKHLGIRNFLFLKNKKQISNGKNPYIVNFLKEAKYIDKVMDIQIGKMNLYEKYNGKIIYYGDK